ncbi:ribosomal RNA-processing protein 7-domain-containing protein [Crucibulum laeve]|uniref:Ribosomal RNA-processing protein 7-domain-containing protein n=1 Tax=Crucibulum laeve TaxID=68775 RepID=A0A5C3MFC4_9AGAR|nr:ribosomal RNA-processing protein 7-domain-containing protein [Crucibulum laeve]
MALPASISGFSVLPVSYSPNSTHYIYARAHTGSKKGFDLPSTRTLFLVNIPPDATERELTLLFKQCGAVERVVFDFDAQELNHDDSDSEDEEDEETGQEEAATEQPRKRRKVSKNDKPVVIPLPPRNLRTLRKTGRSAHIVFLDTSSLARALVSPHKMRQWPVSEEPHGLAHYQALYESLRPPLDAVREHADTSINLYEYEVAKSKQKSKYRKGEAIVDEDGFTLVTRGGAYGQTLGGGVGVASKRFQQTGHTAKNRNRKKEKKEKEGFYAFQKAEKQRQELMDLKTKWEEDKAKVEKLKASRRFKPY